MIKFFFIISISAFFISCAPKYAEPLVDLKRLQDPNYPCIRIDFPDQIRLLDTKIKEIDDYLALIYELAMPNYKIDVVKLYSFTPMWSMAKLTDIHDGDAKIYEKIDFDDPTISAVILITVIDKDLFLRGSIGKFIASDRAVRIDIYRRIKTVGAFRRGAVDRWLASAAGKRTVENMKKIINYTFTNMKNVECSIHGNIDINWWKK